MISEVVIVRKGLTQAFYSRCVLQFFYRNFELKGTNKCDTLAGLSITQLRCTRLDGVKSVNPDIICTVKIKVYLLTLIEG